ncbi:MAG: putative metalloprotease CJM1_0395 family protein [Roseibium sp.]
MIGALLSNTPANLLRSNGVAADNAPGSEENSRNREPELARESQASSRVASLRSNNSAPLTPEAVLALQESEEAPEVKSGNSDQTDQKTSGQASQQGGSAPASQAAQPAENSDEEDDADGDGLNEAEEKQVEKLAQRDREVKAHEQAHARVGGAYASAPSYTFQQGPDGKRYAVGGEVQIDTSTERTPEATIRKMNIVIRAATAPAEPSSQDMKVAQQARSQMAEAQVELRQQKAEELSGDDDDDITGGVEQGDNTSAINPLDASGGADAQGAESETNADSNNEDDQSSSRQSFNDTAIAAYQSAIQNTNDAQSIFGALIA